MPVRGCRGEAEKLGCITLSLGFELLVSFWLCCCCPATPSAPAPAANCVCAFAIQSYNYVYLLSCPAALHAFNVTLLLVHVHGRSNPLISVICVRIRGTCCCHCCHTQVHAATLSFLAFKPSHLFALSPHWHSPLLPHASLPLALLLLLCAVWVAAEVFGSVRRGWLAEH